MLLQALDALAPVLGEHDLHPALLERRGEGEHVADVVVDDQHLLALQRRVAAAQLPEHLARRRGRSASTRCRYSAARSISRSGESTTAIAADFASASSRARSGLDSWLGTKAITGARAARASAAISCSSASASSRCAADDHHGEVELAARRSAEAASAPSTRSSSASAASRKQVGGAARRAPRPHRRARSALRAASAEPIDPRERVAPTRPRLHGLVDEYGRARAQRGEPDRRIARSPRPARAGCPDASSAGPAPPRPR